MAAVTDEMNPGPCENRVFRKHFPRTHAIAGSCVATWYEASTSGRPVAVAGSGWVSGTASYPLTALSRLAARAALSPYTPNSPPMTRAGTMCWVMVIADQFLGGCGGVQPPGPDGWPAPAGYPDDPEG